MNHIRKVVIIGSTHHNTYSMVRCFGESGINPDVILCGKLDSYVLLSKYIDERHIALDAADALRLLKENYSEAVVITCADDIASLMDLNYDDLFPRYQFFNCGSTGKLSQFMDKAVQTQLAARVGFSVPLTVEGMPSEVKDKKLPSPCIIKPLESIHGGKNIHVCFSKSDFPSIISFFNPDERVIVQEYIEKDYEIVVVGLSYKDEIVIPAFIHKIRDTKGGTTYASVKPIDELLPDVVISCKKLIAEMNYMGLFGVELIRKGDDYFFVEINLRNDATTYALAVAGCNLPLVYYKMVQGEEYHSLLSKPIIHINSIVEFSDLIHVLKRHVALKTWIKQLREAECRYCFSKSDIRPYRRQRSNFLVFIIKMLFFRICKWDR